MGEETFHQVQIVYLFILSHDLMTAESQRVVITLVTPATTTILIVITTRALGTIKLLAIFLMSLRGEERNS